MSNLSDNWRVPGAESKEEAEHIKRHFRAQADDLGLILKYRETRRFLKRLLVECCWQDAQVLHHPNGSELYYRIGQYDLGTRLVKILKLIDSKAVALVMDEPEEEKE